MLKTILPAVTVSAMAASARAEIVIDGQFDDWTAVATAVTDPADAPRAEVDFGEIKIAHDDEHVHFLVDFGRTVSLQRLDGRVLLMLDADGDAGSGQTVHGTDGIDLIVELSPRDPRQPKRPGMGMGVRAIGAAPVDPGSRPMSPYEIGLMMGPTCAADLYEFRIDRGSMVPPVSSMLEGDDFTIKLVAVDANNKVADQTEALTYALDPRPCESRDAATDPLARSDGTAVRVMSWNAERGSIFERPAPYMRTIAALDPDVILFQELTDRNTAEQLRSLLNQSLPDDEGGWNVVYGRGGGNLRCAVASRFPVSPVATLDLVPFQGREDRTVRVIGAVVDVEGRNLLATSVHLKCCGSLDSREDNIRRTEVTEIRNAIASAMKSGKIDGIVVGGDMNLVGSCEILTTLADGVDVDRSPLDVAAPYQLDGLSNATWTDAGQPFVPGRLDYVLTSGASLRPTGSFVFESDDLSPEWLTEHGLRAEDSRSSSDHLPVIVDLDWR